MRIHSDIERSDRRSSADSFSRSLWNHYLVWLVFMHTWQGRLQRSFRWEWRLAWRRRSTCSGISWCRPRRSVRSRFPKKSTDRSGDTDRDSQSLEVCLFLFCSCKKVPSRISMAKWYLNAQIKQRQRRSSNHRSSSEMNMFRWFVWKTLKSCKCPLSKNGAITWSVEQLRLRK